MRILTVRQPWAWAIIHGQKTVENRVRNIAGDYRGPVAIHAGLAPFEKDNRASRAHREAHGSETPTTIHYGAIIGVVDLVGVHATQANGECRPMGLGFCSSWAEPDAYHLVLSNPRPLAKPIPYKGALGLRRFNETVDAEILRELAEVAL